jgi:ATP-binding cassette, subfamily B, bacterial
MRRWRKGIWFMVTSSFRAAPGLASAVVALVGLSAVLAPLAAVGLRGLVNAAIRHDLHAAVVASTLTAVITVVAWGAQNVGISTLRMTMEERTRLYLERHLLSLATGIPGIGHHERGDVADQMALLRAGAAQLSQPAGPLVFLFQAVLSLLSIVGLLGAVDARLALLPLFGLPALAAAMWSARIDRVATEDVIERRRLGAWLFRLGTSPTAANEVRVFGLADELGHREHALGTTVLTRKTRADVAETVLQTAGSLVFAAGYVGAVALVAVRAVHRQATVGDVLLTLTLAALVNALVAQTSTMTTWLAQTLKLVDRYLTVEDLAAAEQAPADPIPAPDRLQLGIRFESVSFTYPDTEAPVLDEVNLELPAGSVVALVGDNGAGKSTLVKLLCGFYRPSAGAITIDGCDLARIPLAEWRTRLSGAFQDFAKLNFVARESVGVGDLTAIDDADLVHGALERAHAIDVLDAMPDGLDTQLGRQFDDGVELSGGQWQKLALARALMRQTPLLLVLDEPTASLDAETEHVLFERYATAARATATETGAITLLVSHRFSTVRMADLIVVVDDGHVTESGTHSELVERGGTYAELYQLQATAYR